jgi:hypothetical protein
MSNSIGGVKEQNIPAQHLIGIKVRLLQRLTASQQPFISGHKHSVSGLFRVQRVSFRCQPHLRLVPQKNNYLLNRVGEFQFRQ